MTLLKLGFLPAGLRWMGIGCGACWVVDLAPDRRDAIINEYTSEYS